MTDKLSETLRFNQNIQSILDDALINDERSQELMILNIKNIIQELGIRFLSRLLFNGFIQSIKDIDIDTLVLLKKESHKILATEKQKNRRLNGEENDKENVENNDEETFSFETTSNDLKYYISSFLDLGEAINLQLLNHELFYTFRAIPFYDKMQVNENWMKWFNSEIIDNCDNGHDLTLPSKFKTITEFNLKNIPIAYDNDDDDDDDEDDEDQDDDIEHNEQKELDLSLINSPFYKSLESFKSLECLGLIDNDQVNDAIIQNLPKQENLETVWCIGSDSYKICKKYLNAFKKFGESVIEIRFHRWILDIDILQIIMDNYLPNLLVFNFGFESMFNPGHEAEHSDDDSLVIKYESLTDKFIEWIKNRDKPILFQYFECRGTTHFRLWVNVLEALMHSCTSFHYVGGMGAVLLGEIQQYLDENYQIDQDNLIIKCNNSSYWQNLTELCYDSQLEHIKFALAILQNAPKLKRLHLRFPARLIPTVNDRKVLHKIFKIALGKVDYIKYSFDRIGILPYILYGFKNNKNIKCKVVDLHIVQYQGSEAQNNWDNDANIRREWHKNLDKLIKILNDNDILWRIQCRYEDDLDVCVQLIKSIKNVGFNFEITDYGLLVEYTPRTTKLHQLGKNLQEWKYICSDHGEHAGHDTGAYCKSSLYQRVMTMEPSHIESDQDRFDRNLQALQTIHQRLRLRQ